MESRIRLGMDARYGRGLHEVKDLECPYCEHSFDYDMSDGCVREDDYEEITCPECDKIFEITVSWHPNFTERKTPCLNKEIPHEYEEACRFPRISRGGVLWRCKTCSGEKTLPDGEVP